MSAAPTAAPRRRFLKWVTGLLGFLLALIPGGAGLMVLLDPVRRRGSAGAMAVPVARLSALPADGRPRKFTIITDREDAWTRYPATPVGAVYLRRRADGEIQALNVVCPHAGCFVDYAAEAGHFFCPCHNSAFDLEGHISDPDSPSPRAMDTLAVEVRGEEIWVRFQNFQPGHAEKVPVA